MLTKATPFSSSQTYGNYVMNMNGVEKENFLCLELLFHAKNIYQNVSTIFRTFLLLTKIWTDFICCLLRLNPIARVEHLTFSLSNGQLPDVLVTYPRLA